MMAWDDGVDSNAYIADIGPTQATNFRLSGQAIITPGWTAGYLLRLQVLLDSTMGLSQFVNNQDLGVNVQMSNWFVASEDYGKVTMGRQALASKSVAMFTDLSGTQLIANYVLFDGPGFFLRQDGALLKLRWGDIGYCYAQSRPWGGDCDGIVMSGVRYDSPTYAGFSWSASYGASGDYEAAARYVKEMGGFKLALGTGYSVNKDENTQPPPVSLRKDSGFFQAGFYVEHLKTGLFLHGDYGTEDNHGSLILSGLAEPDSQQWYVKGGIRRKWTSLGMTILYGEYTEYLDQTGPAALNAGVTASEFTRFGFGAVQEIDSAAMSLWIKYRQHDGALTGGPFDGDLDAFRYISTGAIIYF
jgi:predicted porin